jgi:hypothetical protein
VALNIEAFLANFSNLFQYVFPVSEHVSHSNELKLPQSHPLRMNGCAPYRSTTAHFSRNFHFISNKSSARKNCLPMENRVHFCAQDCLKRKYKKKENVDMCQKCSDGGRRQEKHELSDSFVGIYRKFVLFSHYFHTGLDKFLVNQSQFVMDFRDQLL